MMKAKKILGDLETLGGPVAVGIDQSYTGFALTAMDLDVHRFYTALYVLPGTGVDRLNEAQTLVWEFLEDFTEVHDVAIEGYSFGSANRAHMAGELGGAVRLSLRDYFYGDHVARYPLIISPSQVKKYATGRGNAKKNEVLLGVFKRFGVEFTDDNMADSYVLARLSAGLESNQADRDLIAAIAKTREGP